MEPPNCWVRGGILAQWNHQFVVGFHALFIDYFQEIPDIFVISIIFFIWSISLNFVVGLLYSKSQAIINLIVIQKHYQNKE